MTRVQTTRQRARGEESPDAVTFLTWYLVLLLCIPSHLVVAGVGAAGRPAGLLGLVGLAWWIYFHVQRTSPTGSGRRPVRLATLVFALTFFGSYVVAMARPIAPQESSTANLGMAGLLGWLGVLLVAHDGIPSRRRFDTLVDRVVLAGAALATLAVAQFVLGAALVDSISVPGLVANSEPSGLFARSGIFRPAATAVHPIEFGAVITLVLPLAICRARWRTEVSLLRRSLPVAVMGLAIVVSGSRSALVSAVVALICLAVVWSPRTRLAAAAVVVTLLGVVAVTIPGILGNIANLFLGISNDGSVASRTDSYGLVWEFFSRHPVTGRGFSTFLPTYRILDNAYLLMLVEVGIAGLVAFLGLLLTAVHCAGRVRRTSPDPSTREMAQALIAGVAAAAVGLVTYDGLAFPMATGVMFLVLGMCGALLRLEGGTGPGRTPGVDRAGRVQRRERRARRGRAFPITASVTAVLALSACTATSPAEEEPSRAAEPPPGEPRPRSSTVAGISARGWPGPDTTGADAPRRRIGGLNITRSGTVLSDVVVQGQVVVEADDVTLRNVHVRSGDWYGVLVLGRGVLLEDVTIEGIRGTEAGMAGLAAEDGGQFTARRVDVHRFQDGVRLGDNCELRDSYVHDLLATGEDPHYDAVTANNHRGWVIEGNTILNHHGDTAAVWVGDSRGPASEGLLRGNLVGGGGYTIYGGPGTGRGVRVVDNSFTTRFFPDSGYWGPVTSWVPAVNTWSGNVWHDGPRANQLVDPEGP